MIRSDIAQIDCPIGIFSRYEAELMRLASAINQAGTTQAKASYAQDSIASASVLIACQEYNEDSLDCCMCRNVTSVRRQTATLVLKGIQIQSTKLGLS